MKLKNRLISFSLAAFGNKNRNLNYKVMAWPVKQGLQNIGY